MKINALDKSALVEAAAEAVRPTRWWLAMLLSIVVGVIIVGAVVETVYTGLVPNVSGSLQAQMLELFTNAGTLLALWAWLRFKERRAFSSVGFRGGRAIPKFLAGIAIGAGMMMLCVAVLLGLGQYQVVAAPAGGASGSVAIVPVLLLALVWTVQSSTEETVMRGYLLQTSARQLPGWLAILAPGVLFSAVHFATEEPLPIAGLNILIYALFVSFIALRQGSLWLACGIHTGWNWFQGNVFGLPVSGNAYNTGVFHLGPKASSSPWLGGGAFGPENSLVVTAVWGAALLLAYVYFRKAQRTDALP